MDETQGLSERTPLLSVAALHGTQSGSGSITKSDRHTEVPNQEHSVCIRTVVLILIAVFCERLAFFSIFFNLILFCMSELNFTGFEASTVYWILTGTAYVIIPLIGGYIADSMCGRYRTILGSGFIFLIGTLVLFFSAADFIHWQDRKDVRKALLITGLVVVTIGSGSLQANIIPFGAQHITHLGPRAVQSFCHWYYWARNLGCISSSSVVYLQQERKQFCWGYLMSMMVLLAGLVIFGLGHNIYNHVPPSVKYIGRI